LAIEPKDGEKPSRGWARYTSSSLPLPVIIIIENGEVRKLFSTSLSIS
jgi:hypothetical protein